MSAAARVLRIRPLSDTHSAEVMLLTWATADGRPQTAHSLNPVPFVVTVRGAVLAGGGILADVAPTALALLGIEQPPAMSGTSLLIA